MKTILIPTLVIALALPLAAQQKVSDRVSLPAATLDPAIDILPIVDISAGLSGSKKITIDELFEGWGFTTAGTALATAADAPAQRTALGFTAAGTAIATAADTTAQRTALGFTGNIYNLSYGTAAGNLVRLDATTGKLPAVDGSLLTNLPSGGAGTFATQAEAEAGTNSTNYMNPLRTAQAIAALSPAASVTTTNTATLTNKTLGIGTVINNATMTLGSDGTGDIYYRAAGGALTRLPAATDGNVLTLSSGLPAWAAAAGGSAPFATQAEAEAGTNTANYMNPLRTAQAIAALSPAASVTTTNTATLTNKTLGSGTVINNATMTLGSDGTGDIYYRAAGGALTRLPAATDGNVLTLSSGLPAWAAAAGGGGLTNWADAIGNSAPNETVPAASLTATNAAASVDAVISPKGNGALQAAVANNLASGGNKRGSQAVDLQLARTFASEVASGTGSVLLGGGRNVASGQYSIKAGGYNGNATGYGSAFIGGLYGTVSGDYAGAVAGESPSVTASYAFSGAGYSNTVSGTAAAIIGGGSNTAGGGYSAVIAGNYCVAGGTYGYARGGYADNRSIYGAAAEAAGNFAVSGDAQIGRYILRRQTSDATQSSLTPDGSAGTSANLRVTLGNNSVHRFTAMVVGRMSDGTSTTVEMKGAIKRGANAASTALIGSVTYDVIEDAGASAWDVVASAETTYGSLDIRVTGASATIIRWVGRVDTVEVTY